MKEGMQNQNQWVVIMAGGSGTRFWPVSRTGRPKQLTALLGSATMIQATVGRLQGLVPAERILVITTAAIADATRQQLPGLPAENIIAEPEGRDTAPCVGLAAAIIAARDPNGVMALLPADQLIEPVSDLHTALKAGYAIASAHRCLATYGIAPRFAATGYGYICLGEDLPETESLKVNQVQSFVEKPDEPTAKEYLAQGNYRWNSGMFTWRADVVLDALQEHCPDLAEAVLPLGEAFGSNSFDTLIAERYPTLTKISIDYALMEKHGDIRVITPTFTWDDLGSWDSLRDHLPQDDTGVATSGTCVHIDCHNSLFFQEAGAPPIAAIGVSDLSVVASPESILIVPTGASQRVKQLQQHVMSQRDS
jgi:mannose-1-phosphate guanylyltransferase